MSFKKIKLGFKINLIVGAIILLLSATMVFVAQNQIKQAMGEVFTQQNEDVSKLGLEYLNAKIPGDWSIKEGQLYKGDTKINGQTELVDAIGNITKGAVTLFQGDTRVATNVVVNGQRAVGTKAIDLVAETVLKEGKTFEGVTDIVGTANQTRYEPIKIKDGQVVGMWLIGTPVDTIDKKTQSAVTVLLIIIIIATIAAIVAITFFSKTISRRLQKIDAALGEAGSGNFTVVVEDKSGDEIGQLVKSFNQMKSNLVGLIGKVQGASIQIAAAAEQISASTEEIASGSTNQALAAQTMNELFKELSLAINSVAQNTEIAAELSNKTIALAKEGELVVRSSTEGMKLVNQQVSRLEEDSAKVGEIIQVIDDIADQTNLLALNAAIEAARAGDQGRGFAVVADEVRKLAERSGEATKQITSIIKGMQENTSQSVKAVADSNELTEKTGEAFGNIVGIINEAARKVEEIAAASEEQAAQSSEVTLSIESISATTEETAAGSEETAATAQSLAQLAEELQHAVAIFKVY